MADFDLTALAMAQQKLAELGCLSKEAFTPIPGGNPVPAGGSPPLPPPDAGGPQGMPPGPPPPGGMPPGMPPGGAGGMDPSMMMSAMQQMGMQPPQEQSQPVAMTIDQLIKLVSAITGKGGASKKHDKRLTQLEMILQHNGIPVPPDESEQGNAQAAGGPQQSAIQPQDGNTAGGLMGPINPMQPMKTSRSGNPVTNIIERLRNRL